MKFTLHLTKSSTGTCWRNNDVRTLAVVAILLRFFPPPGPFAATVGAPDAPVIGEVRWRIGCRRGVERHDGHAMYLNHVLPVVDKVGTRRMDSAFSQTGRIGVNDHPAGFCFAESAESSRYRRTVVSEQAKWNAHVSPGGNVRNGRAQDTATRTLAAASARQCVLAASEATQRAVRQRVGRSVTAAASRE